MRRRWVVWGLLLMGLLAAAGGAGRAWAVHRLRSELEQATRDLDAQLYGRAVERLRRLAKRWPRRGEVEFQLGRCEQAIGQRERALAAFSRVPRSSPFHASAMALLGNELINIGRYGPAESALESARDQGSYEVDRALSRLYRFEGRTADVRRVLQASWSRSPDPAGVLRELWLLDKSPQPVEALGLALEKADPGDDRVWLGRANLALLLGQTDQARRWLEACHKRRASDPPVWLAWLDMAHASGDVGEVQGACEHLPASAFSTADLLALRAWLAARRGDRALEAPGAFGPGGPRPRPGRRTRAPGCACA